MAAAQGIAKITTWKRQAALGTAASGTGGTAYRRRTSVFSKPIDTFENDEIVSHQMSTGVGIGGSKPMGKVDGLLSPGAYSDWFSALVRRDFTSVTAMASVSLTIAGSGPTYTVTRASGSFLTDGVKVGHVVRLSVGALNAANISKNLLVIGLTGTVLTVKPVNAVALVAEGPVTGCTVTVIGKVTYVPTTSHTSIYYTFEEWMSSVPASETYTDAMIAKADVTIQASGNASVSFDIPALARVRGTSQVLTSPGAAAGNDVVTGAMGVLTVNGSVIGSVTGVQFSIDGKTQHADLVLGSTVSDDHQRGRVTVTGSFTAKFDSTALQAIFDAGSTTSLVCVVAEDLTATADFISFAFPTIKLTSDAPDDGEKQIVRTYSFTAQYNSAGGAGIATEQTIVQIQDSAT